MPEVRDAVVVITGGSSGIGRCAALAFAREKAKLVLAARNEKALHQAAKECRKLGAKAIAVECDVTQEEEVQKVADRAIEEFGGIDVWINNAGVGVYGRFEDVPSRHLRQQIDTLLFGVINGARAALKQFRQQGGRGVLIDVSSQVATGGIPYQSGYAAAKYAIRMFDDTLRQELQDTPEIQVCTVLPSSTDTPFFQHAANFTGKAVKPLGNVSPPEDVARTMVKLVRDPERQVYIGTHGYFMGAAHALIPETYNRFARRMADQEHFEDIRVEKCEGNLFEPQSPEEVYGGWRERQHESRASKIPLIATIGGVAVGTVLLARRARSRARQQFPGVAEDFRGTPAATGNEAVF